jgi:hypothetical protein
MAINEIRQQARKSAAGRNGRQPRHAGWGRRLDSLRNGAVPSHRRSHAQAPRRVALRL